MDADESVLSHLLSVVRATREHDAVSLGASPRASRALLAVSRAYTAIHGRSYVVPEDVETLAPSVLAHRLVLSGGFAGAEGMVREVVGSSTVSHAA